jgi:uncharacterized FAD-dependent dehydrogenase
MGYKEIDIKVPIHITDKELKQFIGRKAQVKIFTYQIIKKSLDARQKNNIFWLFRFGIVSDEIRSGEKPEIPALVAEFKKRAEHILVVGSGPAGIFSALYLSLCGFKVTIVERGSKVEIRKEAIDTFEKTEIFNASNNYAFGEGGAGTFSDGKLTSRTKGISLERNFIFNQFIESGAPVEIFYMTHPHLGSDNLYRITQNIRKKLESSGCTFLCDTLLTDLIISEDKVTSAITSKGSIEADYFIIATGHSAFETYRMLIKRGVPFHIKNFALGFRAEHYQEIINIAQWGVPNIRGVKAAEYRLTSQTSDNSGVYSFCMCPGGIVVPATAYSHTNVVNGMSNYQRNNKWANAAVVASVNLQKLLEHEVSALEALDWLEKIESLFYQFSGNYNAPACLISNFLSGKNSGQLPSSSYPFKLIETDFKDLLPPKIIKPLKEGLQDFCLKLKGYETGIILGLESKTSSPVQIDRDPDKMNSKYANLYIAGEGSGWAGGIISSASDGLKIARQISNN